MKEDVLLIVWFSVSNPKGITYYTYNNNIIKHFHAERAIPSAFLLHQGVRPILLH